MKYNIVYLCIKLKTYRFCRYRKDSVIIGSVDDICGAFLRRIEVFIQNYIHIAD